MISTRHLILLALCCQAAPAAYSNLVTTADGSMVWFQAKTGFGDPVTYTAQAQKGALLVQQVARPVVDVSANGSVAANAFYGQRYCGSPGSTCFVAPPCSASFGIQGSGVDVGGTQRPTFVRLDREGRRAWIDQQGECRGLGPAPPAALNGVYELPSMRQLAAANGAVLANRRTGRRLITNSGQALTFKGLQLQLGPQAIRHVAGAYEAVIDAAGANVVYTEAAPGKLHWIDVAANMDEDLGLSGSAPALSDDGRLLAFLGADGALQVYDRQARTTRTLLTGVEEFTLAGGGQAAFATQAGKLVRIDVASGERFIWLEPVPEVSSISTPQAPLYYSCPTYCYGTPDPYQILGRGAMIVLAGHNLDQPGWRARTGGVEMALNPFSAEAAWFQVPAEAPGSSDFQPIEIFNPNQPLRFTFKAQLQDRVITCFGTLHQDFSRLVSEQDPAAVNEIVHVFLTGLRGAPPVQDGIPNPVDHLVPVMNPPQIAGDGALQPLFFGLAPGWIGLQQLDLRVLRAVPLPFPEAALPPLFPEVSAAGCTVPPVAP